MAEMAVADGIAAIVATPHQLGNYPQNTVEKIRAQTAWLQQILERKGVALQLLPGADVRIDPDLTSKIQNDEVLTLADRRRHVLLELPHEVYIPLDRLLSELNSASVAGILSHPERNQGILKQPNILWKLVEQGCLFQVTAGSLLGMFGSRIKKFAQTMVEQGLVDIIATDAHSVESRIPVLSHAFGRVVELAGYDTANNLFCRNPACVIAGMPITSKGADRKKQTSFRSGLFFNTARQFVHF